jgi:hypothetical protein
MNRQLRRSDFYNELSEEKRKEFFYYKRDKFLPTIDNIYYTVFIEDDKSDNLNLRPFLQWLERIKENVLLTRQLEEVYLGVNLERYTFQNYKYCLSVPDLYDIFIMDYLPNDKTPRVIVQVRAFGLWTRGVDEMLSESYKLVEEIFEEYGCYIDKCRENRIDYCYHTNIISNPERIFGDRNINKQLISTLEVWHETGRKEVFEGRSVFRKDYFAMGNRKSNNVFVRCYNKALEVVQEGYKSFFFEIWRQAGLISYYDKYCFEEAYKEKNYNYVHKAKLKFYLEHGTDEKVKKEFELILNDKKSTLEDFKIAAQSYMPELTQITNIEFETKRKFYYTSDLFIDSNLKTMPRASPEALKRIYKIIDNRSVFLEYLTSKTFYFKQSVTQKKETLEAIGKHEEENCVTKEREYVSWWRRLRATKLDGFPVNEKLIREYTKSLDESIIKKRIINQVASIAVYGSNIETEFQEDISDLLSNLNDNDIHKIKVTFEGDIKTELLNDYKAKKQVKEMRLRNRIKKDDQRIIKDANHQEN